MSVDGERGTNKHNPELTLQAPLQSLFVKETASLLDCLRLSYLDRGKDNWEGCSKEQDGPAEIQVLLCNCTVLSQWYNAACDATQ